LVAALALPSADMRVNFSGAAKVDFYFNA